MCMIVNCLTSKLVIWTGLTGTALYFIRKYMQGGQFTRETNETEKVVIVTGCNIGIGKETVKELARRGATVYMACRDMKKCEQARQEIMEETNNRNIFALELDLSSQDSIRNFVTEFQRKEKKLHILINNAGVMRCPRTLTKDGLEQQLGVNHMGHFLLTNLLLDQLKNSAPSRIVNVSSLAHMRGTIKVDDLNSEQSYDEGQAYCQSKLANVLFTRELAKRLEGTGVTVNALHPGVVNTGIARHVGFFNNFLVSIFIRPLVWILVKTAKSGAQTTLYAALDPDLVQVTGQYFSDCAPKKVASAATNDETAKWLWTESEKWTGLQRVKAD